MPSPYNFLIITPNADTAGVAAAIGVTINVPVYTQADPTPREQTHAYANTSWTQALDDAVETPDTGARATFPDSVFIKCHKVNPNDPQWPKVNPQTVLANHVPPLTTNSTT